MHKAKDEKQYESMFQILKSKTSHYFRNSGIVKTTSNIIDISE